MLKKFYFYVCDYFFYKLTREFSSQWSLCKTIVKLTTPCFISAKIALVNFSKWWYFVLLNSREHLNCLRGQFAKSLKNWKIFPTGNEKIKMRKKKKMRRTRKNRKCWEQQTYKLKRQRRFLWIIEGFFQLWLWLPVMCGFICKLAALRWHVFNIICFRCSEKSLNFVERKQIGLEFTTFKNLKNPILWAPNLSFEKRAKLFCHTMSCHNSEPMRRGCDTVSADEHWCFSRTSRRKHRSNP